MKSVVDIGNGESEDPVDPEFGHVMGSAENSLESAHCHALWGETWSRSEESFVLLARKENHTSIATCNGASGVFQTAGLLSPV